MSEEERKDTAGLAAPDRRGVTPIPPVIVNAGTDMSGLEYALFLDSALSRIVNGSI